MAASKLRPGVYVPIVTPFKQDGSEDIDLEAFKINVRRLSKAGCGFVLAGTLGEGNLLDSTEKAILVKTAREALKVKELENPTPLIAGINGESLRQCIANARSAAEAGADAVVVVAPAYFAFAYGKDKTALKTFFTTLADKSPLPLFLYNASLKLEYPVEEADTIQIPFAAGGIDMDSDMLIELSEHQNIVGVKLTCYGIAKGHRVAMHVKSAAYKARHPLPFLVLPGGSDYLLPGLVARQDGTVSGPANLYPHTMVELFNLSKRFLETGDPELFRSAQELQDIVTAAEGVIGHAASQGFTAIKAAMDIHVAPRLGAGSLGGHFRSPLSPVASEAVRFSIDHGLRAIFEVEDRLSNEKNEQSSGRGDCVKE